jgi:hypothetical protein
LRYHPWPPFILMAHPELDALFHTLLPFAQTMLREHGEFYPFGAIMTSSGDIQQIGAKIEGDDHPRSQPLIDLLTEAFQEQAKNGQLRAAGICCDVLTVPPGEHQKRNAVCCCLEHCSGETVNVFVPYVKADGNIQYGGIFAAKRTAQFFCKLPSA